MRKTHILKHGRLVAFFVVVSLYVVLVGCGGVGIREEDGPLFQKYGFRFSDYGFTQAEQVSAVLAKIYPKGADPNLVKNELEASGVFCFYEKIERKENGEIWAYYNQIGRAHV